MKKTRQSARRHTWVVQNPPSSLYIVIGRREKINNKLGFICLCFYILFPVQIDQKAWFNLFSVQLFVSRFTRLYMSSIG